MAEYLRIVGLAVTSMLALWMFASAITGIVRRRVKIERFQRAVVFREQPVKFMAYILWYLCFAASFAAGAVMFALSLLR